MFGLTLNAIICMAITLTAIGFYISVQETKGRESKPALYSLKVFWILVAITYLFEFVRIIAASIENFSVEYGAYVIASITFSFSSVPLVYFVSYLIEGIMGKKTTIPITLSGAIGTVSILLAHEVITGGYSPTLGIWAITQEPTGYIIYPLLMVIYVFPMLLILALLGFTMRRALPKNIKYKISLSLVAISMVMGLEVVDRLTITGEIQFVSRIFILTGVVLAYLAYFPPLTLKERLKPILDAEEVEIEDGEVEGSDED